MPIDPQVKAHYEKKRAAVSKHYDSQEDAVASTRVHADLQFNDEAHYPPVYAVSDRVIPCFWGAMPIRIYTPGEERTYPILIYYHGGAFMIHNIASHDSICRKLCNECNAMVISVGFRLYPEVRLGDIFTDAYLALEWIRDNATEFGGDPTRMAVAGDSSGAMISAAVAMLARDRRGPKIGLQILVYGTGCGLTEEESESYRELIDSNPVLTRSLMEHLNMVQHENPGVAEVYIYPGRAESLTGMPKTLIITAEYDPLRDDGEEYAHRLKAAGNEVLTWRVPGMTHGFLMLWEEFDKGAFALDEIGRVFRDTFEVHSTTIPTNEPTSDVYVI